MELKNKIIEENARVHDHCAEFHDMAVPYISRVSVRNSIMGLIENLLRANNQSFKGKKVLELGCGTGTFLNLADQREAVSYTGLDVSGEMIKLAKEKSVKNVNVKFIHDNLESFTLQTGEKFDIILAASFLHHLYDIDEGLKQIKSLLNEGGIFICLHEEINTQPDTLIQKMSCFCAKLAGNHGYAQFSIRERIMRVLHLGKFNKWKKLRRRLFRIRLSRNLRVITLFGINIIPAEGPTEYNSNQVDWVDYQLNGNYDLSASVATKFGQVIPYCYYEFEFFKLLSRRNNHFMFVMKY